jgi:hypothetical protein
MFNNTIYESLRTGVDSLSDCTMPSALCRTFAGILGGSAQVVNGVCTVTRLRNNLRPIIQGRRTNSALALAALFSFEDLDRQGNALNLGETVILQEEINPFISQLRMRGIEVTALHNHWLFDNPRLMYIHFKSVEPPLIFAEKVAAAFRVLTSRTVNPNRTGGSCGSDGTRGASNPYTAYESDGCYICSKQPDKARVSNRQSKSSRTASNSAGKAGKARINTSLKKVKRTK